VLNFPLNSIHQLQGADPERVIEAAKTSDSLRNVDITLSEVMMTLEVTGKGEGLVNSFCCYTFTELLSSLRSPDDIRKPGICD